MTTPPIRLSLVRVAILAGIVSAFVFAAFLGNARPGYAVTFDGDLRPSTTDTLRIGEQGQVNSINNTIFITTAFLAPGNVGIGAPSPAVRLEVNGGVRINTTGAQPTCAAGIRGALWFNQPSPSSTDSLQACVKNASDVYAWTTLTP